jgi:hypothetical protein
MQSGIIILFSTHKFGNNLKIIHNNNSIIRIGLNGKRLGRTQGLNAS